MSALIQRPSSWYLSFRCAPGCPKHPQGKKAHFVSLKTKNKDTARTLKKDFDQALKERKARITLGLEEKQGTAADWPLSQFRDWYEKKVLAEQLVSRKTFYGSERPALDSLIKGISDVTLGELTSEVMQGYQRAGRVGVSAHSFNSRRRALRAIFNKAIKLGLIAENPMSHVTPARATNKRPKRLHQEQIEEVIRSIPNELWKLFTLFLYATGVRLSEALALKHDAIRWQSGYIEIETNKENRPKLIALTPAIEAIIRQAHALDASPYVFSKGGKPLAYAAAIMAFRRVSRKVGYPVSAHRFRHSHGTHRVEAGDNLKNVQEALGHSDIRTTSQFYLDVDLQARKAGMQRLPIDTLLKLPTAKSNKGWANGKKRSR